jgi:release factor glutamine methyltransferase
MSTSIAEAILQGSHKLRQAGVAEARREAGSLLGHVLGRDRSFILSHAEDALSDEQAERFRDFVERRAHGEPQQYITGQQEFFGLEFEVSPDVLIPRPETELLVETALKLVSKDAPYVCDVGTGSGCVAIALLYELRKTHDGGFPKAHALAIDISPAALAIAKRNAARHSLTEQIEFVVSDCFASLNSPLDSPLDSRRDSKYPSPPRFDLIVSNPPYVKDGELASLQTEVRDFEPKLALTAGADGLNVIRRLLLDAAEFLKPGGHFLFEIGFQQSVAVEQLIDPKIWTLLRIHEDLQSIPRIVALQKVS